MYFPLKKAFKTFNDGWLKADLLTFVYEEYSVYVVFVCHTNRKYKMYHILNMLHFRLPSSKSTFYLWLLGIRPSIWKTFNQRLTYDSNVKQTFDERFHATFL